ncbi:MAG: DUF2124 domain-containing protein [ANME-2 cluster archaeon]|nr:DUF2124 domain-containing protein [ANME-2 cluster archaeon]
MGFYIRIINSSEGIGGLLNSFRQISKDSQKITFIGTPGFCTPFAELLSFVIRDANKELVFVANTSVENARYIVSTSKGMQLGDPADPSADTVVLLGGLAIPKMNIDAKDIKRVVDDITDPNDRMVIGVCFMSIFQETGWIDVIDFDHILDSHLSVTAMEK